MYQVKNLFEPYTSTLFDIFFVAYFRDRKEYYVFTLFSKTSLLCFDVMFSFIKELLTS